MTPPNKQPLAWRPFFLGILVSFGAASILGWIATGENNWPEFARFHRSITPETLYQPTARQIASLVEAHHDANRILVIIGGSSVMRGAGQSVERLWTRYLQADLGARYIVLNLAMNGAGIVGIGSYMLEMAHKRGWNAIYLADFAQRRDIEPDGGRYFRYFYYDAAARGYLIDWPERDAFLARSSDEQRDLNRLGSKLNAFFNFAELWNYVGYKYFFTIHSPSAGKQFVAHQYLPDDERTLPPDWDFRRMKENAPELFIVRSYAVPLDIGKARETIALCFPPQIRGQMLVTDAGQATYYRNQLSPHEQQTVEKWYRDWQAALNSEGITTHFLNDEIDDRDHLDRVHLSEEGGERFASLLAEAIKDKARALGYVE